MGSSSALDQCPQVGGILGVEDLLSGDAFGGGLVDVGDGLTGGEQGSGVGGGLEQAGNDQSGVGLDAASLAFVAGELTEPVGVVHGVGESDESLEVAAGLPQLVQRFGVFFFEFCPTRFEVRNRRFLDAQHLP
jgi:hypothetical protein